ncbi:hypothetical protein BGZ76_009482 [Entomortierella beljakovae]|nr:hypothetical protein BGZ76_009482 [Entomortierella beljakovae]
MSILSRLQLAESTPLSVVGSILGLVLTLVFYNIFIHDRITPLRHIPSPPRLKSKRWVPLVGHYLDILTEEPGEMYLRWIEMYGPIIHIKDFLNRDQIVIAEQGALNHVLSSHLYDYPKPSNFLRMVTGVVGQGLGLVEGDIHRRQRKLMTPAFGLNHVKKLVKCIHGPPTTLAHIWDVKIKESPDSQVEIEVAHQISCAMLDIIGLAGFGYDFQSLTSPSDEFHVAYIDLHSSLLAKDAIFNLLIPNYRKIPFPYNQGLKKSRQVVDRISSKLINEKRERILQEMKEVKEVPEDEECDLLTVMIRSNEQSDPLKGEKLSDDDLKAQMMMIPVAGHVTPSVTISWALHLLSLYPDIQKSLRQELLDNIGTPNAVQDITYDALTSLPYFSAFVKELLRFVPPVSQVLRVAAKDDVILGYRIPKGTDVVVAPSLLHKMKNVWGPDADEFKPERWMGENAMLEKNWAYIPFLGGPRYCIGAKLALIEIKVVLYHLVTRFEYKPVPGYTFEIDNRYVPEHSPGLKLLISKFDSSTALEEKEK